MILTCYCGEVLDNPFKTNFFYCKHYHSFADIKDENIVRISIYVNIDGAQYNYVHIPSCNITRISKNNKAIFLYDQSHIKQSNFNKADEIIKRLVSWGCCA